MKRSSQSLLALFGLAASVKAQQTCSLNAETKPTMSWQACTSSGGCTSSTSPVTIDSNWRWAHALTSATNCYTGNTWNATLCPSDTACAANCCLDGAGSYENTYGISSSGDALTLDFVTKGQYSTNIGSRTYLLNNAGTEYEMFDLNGKEFTFDVDVSNLPCGLNGALYFVSMDADGGLAKYSGNKAGAPYGTGYCDTQCAMDLKWINGVVGRLFSPAPTLLLARWHIS
jgi:cellulose 1,4-beta-cellobiosidase